jgi:hypothetical protein
MDAGAAAAVGVGGSGRRGAGAAGATASEAGAAGGVGMSTIAIPQESGHPSRSARSVPTDIGLLGRGGGPNPGG